MISTPTVLVLGAGASHPYGYPLGPELVVDLIGHSGPHGSLRQLYPDVDKVIQFHERLRASDVGSIDAFLEVNPDLIALGKFAIAARLGVWSPIKDHKVDPAFDWYRYIWGRLHEGAKSSEGFTQNQLRVLTYNYDTSFERYFARVVKNYFPDLSRQPDSSAIEFVRTAVPVLHLHGDLGGADGVTQAVENRAPYIRRDFVEQAAAGLRIIHEGSPDAVYARAHEWLGWAKRVYFLGFGYHHTNLERLSLGKVVLTHDGSPRWHQIVGSGFGMLEGEINRARSASGGILQSIFPEDCLGLLRKYAFLT